MTLRWGILAPGSIARVFARDLKVLDAGESIHRITTVGSRDSARADDFAREFNVESAFGSYSQVLQRDDVDVVYVANVQSAHYETVMMALEHGKHVLCEKPFALNLAQARKMFAVAKERNLFLMEAMWMRFLPHIVEVLRRINEGAIGKPLFVLADHGQWVYRKENHRLLDPHKGGGALLDLGVYPITLAHLILGKPDSITAHGKLTAMGVDSDVSMIFNYRDSKSALLHTTIEAVTPTRATIVGSEGRIEIERSFYAPTDFTLHRHDGSSFQYENPLIVNGYVGLGEQAKEVLRCIDNEEIESPMRTAQETLEVMGILDQVRETIGLRYPSEIGDTDDSSVVP